MNNYNIICIILFVVLVLIVIALLHKVYRNKKIVQENFNQNEIEEQKSTIKTKLARAGHSEADIDTVMGLIEDDLGNESVSLKKLRDNIITSIKDFKNSIDDDHGDKSSRKQSLEKSLEDTNRELGNKKTQKTGAEAELRQMNSESENRREKQDEINRLNREITSLETKINDLSDDIDAVTEEVNNLNEKKVMISNFDSKIALFPEIEGFQNFIEKFEVNVPEDITESQLNALIDAVAAVEELEALNEIQDILDELENIKDTQDTKANQAAVDTATDRIEQLELDGLASDTFKAKVEELSTALDTTQTNQLNTAITQATNNLQAGINTVTADYKAANTKLAANTAAARAGNKAALEDKLAAETAARTASNTAASQERADNKAEMQNKLNIVDKESDKAEQDLRNSHATLKSNHLALGDKLDKNILNLKTEQELYTDTESNKVEKLLLDEISKYSNSVVELNDAWAKRLDQWDAKFDILNKTSKDTNKEQSKKIEELKIVSDEYQRKKDRISQQYNDFSLGIKELGIFHDNYQKELESILQRRYDVSNSKYQLNKEKQNARLEKIESYLKSIESSNKSSVDTRIKSIKCLGSGDKLNVNALMKVENGVRTDIPSNKHVIFLDDGDNAGCLAISGQGKSEYGIETCEASLLDQQFEIKKITDEDEYKQLIDIDTETEINKKYPSDEPYISYPFSVVTPSEYPGKCLHIDESGLSIQSCKSTVNQRFKTSVISNESIKCRQ